MIYLFSGTPGSGKSLHLAEMIRNRLIFNKPVIANFAVRTDLINKKKKLPFSEIDNYKIQPQFLIDYAKEYWSGKRVIEDHILLVIDEAQILFNAREWHKPQMHEWISFFTQHRKLGYLIVLVAQSDGMLDKQIRNIIEFNFVHRKVSNFGIYGKILSLLSFGKLHIYVKIWYPMKEKVGSEFFRVRKKLYNLYDTYNTFSS